MIDEARLKGMRIQALGAPVKGSTIVNYCCFTESEIAMVNPIKPDASSVELPVGNGVEWTVKVK